MLDKCLCIMKLQIAARLGWDGPWLAFWRGQTEATRYAAVRRAPTMES